MHTIEIAVRKEILELARFAKVCPNAKKLREKGEYIAKNWKGPKTYEITHIIYGIRGSDYARDYAKINMLGEVTHLPVTVYVKITGSYDGIPLKLFVKETHVYKVLDKLTKEHGEKPLVHKDDALIVSMRRVRIRNIYKKRLDPIVLKSLAAVGVAA